MTSLKTFGGFQVQNYMLFTGIIYIVSRIYLVREFSRAATLAGCSPYVTGASFNFDYFGSHIRKDTRANRC